jgi:MoaA/NifB/PqqE/SkfB family radical SAM enzyme
MKLKAVSGTMANMTRPRSSYIEILWRLLIRCNYDCSYCSSEYHDTTSEIPTVEHLITQANKLDAYAHSINKQIYYDFTGGEPFIVKNLPDFFEYLSTLPTTASVSVMTNTSAPAKVYHRAMNFLNDLNFSIHFENNHSTVNEKVEKIIEMHQAYGPERVKANLMIEAGELDLVKQTGQRLVDAGVNTIYKIVNPQIKTDTITVVRPNEKASQVGLYSSKDLLLANYDFYINQYYTEEELKFVRDNTNFKATDKDVTSIWSDGSVSKNHCTELVNNGYTNFKDWTCFAGINGLHIRPDGDTYIALCNQDYLGNLYKDTVVWPTKPVTCRLNRCMHVTDIRIPKYQ